MQSLEPEMEELLLRLVPGIRDQWKGVGPKQVEELELAACQELPRFYRWFLTTMGESMGPLAIPQCDMTAATIASMYQRHLAPEDPRFFLIGIDSEPVMPTSLVYDLQQPVRDDALVLRRPRGARSGGDAAFETFREMLGTAALRKMRILRAPVRCEGRFTEAGGVLQSIAGIMESLGFNQPVPCGPSCGLFERPDAVLACSSAPGTQRLFFFEFGGSDEGALRTILGSIAADSPVEVQVKGWTPPTR